MYDFLSARLSRFLLPIALVVLPSWTGVSAAEATVSFELDVQPILTAKGCNAGACHGKQRGQNGFQLSLLGFDAGFDYDAIVRQSRGRRVMIRLPQESLLLQKATAQLPHGGGQKIDVGSEDYQTLLRWIREGTPRRVSGEPKLDGVQLAESEFSLRPGAEQSLSVIAHFSNGASRDVTARTSYLSNDAAVAAVDDRGTITAGSIPGETAVMARYMNHICVANVRIPRSEPLPPDYFETRPRANFIDDLVYAKLNELAIQVSEPAGDAVFLRRAYTDIIGRLPTAAEAAAFLDSSDSQKRTDLVDELLDRPEYVDRWANLWADLLRPNPYRVGIKAVLNYDNWIRDQFRSGASHDEFVRRLVTARGSTWHNGAVTLFRDRRSPEEMATLVSRLFLGVRLECAKCHHHPFEKWSQRDFYSFAAFFAEIGRKGKGLSPPISGSEEIIFHRPGGEVRHPVTGEPLDPKPLFGSVDLADDRDPRQALARWMTSPKNDLFAKVHVNRVWAVMMGRGLVEPVDDLRSTNPPTNPALLAALAEHFQATGYDQRELIKTIARSNVYALRSAPNETNASDRLNYSRHYRHRIRAETLADAIADVTETAWDFAAMPPGSRASQVWTHRVDSTFLDTFGRPNENQDPPCERVSDSSVTQTLHLMNSRELDRRIRSDAGRAAHLAAGEMSAGAIVDELYLAIFSRRPTAAERDDAAALIESGDGDRRVAIENLMWAMLNAPEFIFQN